MGTKCKDNFQPYWQDESDWLYTVEFVLVDDSEARFYAADIIGYLIDYAQLTKTRPLALLGAILMPAHTNSFSPLRL